MIRNKLFFPWCPGRGRAAATHFTLPSFPQFCKHTERRADAWVRRTNKQQREGAASAKRRAREREANHVIQQISK